MRQIRRYLDGTPKCSGMSATAHIRVFCAGLGSASAPEVDQWYRFAS